MLNTVLLDAPGKVFRAVAVAGMGAWLAGCATPQEGVNTLGMVFVRVPAGSFAMGCGESDDACSHDEKPRQLVTISEPFYLGKYEVTQAQWAAVMGTQPGAFRGDDLPAENVSWDDAKEFIRRLNALEGGNRYRLPTEAEWEYAARAGTMTKYSFDASRAGEYAWFWDNSDSRTHPVGTRLPNPLGLHDMHGNVWEWVQDWYGEDWYARQLSNAPGNPLRGTKSLLKDEKGFSKDPAGPPEGTFRVLRGGSWSNDVRYLRSAHRHGYPPGTRRANAGFRVALSASQADLKAVEAKEKEKDSATRSPQPGRGDGQSASPATGTPSPETPKVQLPDLPRVQMPDVPLPSVPQPKVETPTLRLPSFP